MREASHLSKSAGLLTAAMLMLPLLPQEAMAAIREEKPLLVGDLEVRAGCRFARCFNSAWHCLLDLECASATSR